MLGNANHIYFSLQGFKLKTFKLHWRPWTAFQSVEDGYSRWTFHNASHMSIEQVAISKTGTSSVIDSVTIVKEAHLPYELLKKTDRGYVPREDL